MSLPLLKRAAEDDVTFGLTRRPARGPAADVPRLPRTLTADALRLPLAQEARMPQRSPGPGEQYRFHADMRRCIGCKCCVVACNEQNGNPASINWRRVGEVEGGWYPEVMKSYLSMGCNHCLEPTCLEGCPVDAYTKDLDTGIVRHSADACIGCQYCTWNCSYGVPQYNPERGVVGKCDMCHGRLELGQTPACVSACPEGAIAIEIVNVADWRALVASSAPGAGLSPDPSSNASSGIPSADGSLSTTRVTMPGSMPPDARPFDIEQVTPAEPHWPLVVMTVLTQLAVGAFAAIWLLELFGAGSGLAVAAVGSLLVGGLALAASTLHLGRPVHAYRALRMWRRSWLSREVLLFTAFSAVAGLYAGMLWFGLPGGSAVGALTVALGAAGVTASAYIYRVASRPAWNAPYTLFQFSLTAGILGPLFALAVGAGDTRWLAPAAASMAGVQLVLLARHVLRCSASDSIELQGTARLLSTVLARRLLARGVLLVLGAVVLPLVAAGQAGPSFVVAAALAAAVAAELAGRHLFFVSVVPRHMAAPYISEAA